MNRYIQIFVVPLLLCCFVNPTYGANLQDVITEALQNNKELKALRFQVEAKHIDYDTAGAWQPPRLGITQFGDSIETKLGPQEQVISLRQQIPAFGETGQKEKIAELGFQKAELQLELVQRNLKEKITLLYIQIWRDEQLIKLYQKNQKLLERLVELGGAEGYTNLTVLGQVFQSEALEERNAYEVLEVQERIERERMELNYQLGRGGLRYPDKIQMQEKLVEVEPLGKLALQVAQHPQLRIKAVSLAMAKEKKNFAELKQYSPTFEVGVNYIQIAPGNNSFVDNGKDASSITLGMSLPFGNSKLKGNAGTSAKYFKSAEQNLENEKAWVQKELAQRYSAYKQAILKRALYKDQLIPQAKKRKDLAQRLYSTGRSKAVHIMKAQIRLLETTIRGVQVEAESWMSMASLEWLIVE